MRRDSPSWAQWAELNAEEFRERWHLSRVQAAELLDGLERAFEAFSRPSPDSGVDTPRVRGALQLLERAFRNVQSLEDSALQEITGGLSFLPADAPTARRTLRDLSREAKNIRVRLAGDAEPDLVAKRRARAVLGTLAADWERVTGKADKTRGPSSALEFYKQALLLQRSWEVDTPDHQAFSRAVLEGYVNAVRRMLDQRKSAHFRHRI